MTEPPGNGDESAEDDDKGKQRRVVPSAAGKLVDPDISSLLKVIEEIQEVERRRAEAQEARNGIALRALEVAENSDLRQYEYH